MSIGTTLCCVLLQRYQSDSTIWLQNIFEKLPLFHICSFSIFQLENLLQTKFLPNQRSWLVFDEMHKLSQTC